MLEELLDLLVVRKQGLIVQKLLVTWRMRNSESLQQIQTRQKMIWKQENIDYELWIDSQLAVS